MKLSVLSVASEAYPLVKTGGLADVVGALPAAVAPFGIELTTLIPGYPVLAQRVKRARVAHQWQDLLGAPARLLATSFDGQPLLVLDAPALFARPGGLYDHPDDWRRFAALARAAADLASGAARKLKFDLLHAHDWQAALAPAYLRFAPGPAAAAKSVVTVHNIAFQGRFGSDVFPGLGLPDAAFAIDGVEYYGDVSFLKGGLEAADAITTVSPTYAQEIRSPRFGMGLEGLISARAARVTGIINGIGPAVWSSATDRALVARYSVSSLDRRVTNKRAVERAFGLDPGDGPLFCVVSRLAWQKGIDMLAAAADALVAMGARLAVLGAGDRELEELMTATAARHPGRIGVRLGYDEGLSHQLQGGADAILVPSRFEPCGLTQLYGLAYGCVPVVARTGGLADTVIDANEAALAAGVATGIQFGEVTVEALTGALARAVNLYADAARWRQIQKNGMRADFTWAASGRRYAELYRAIAGQG